MKVKTTYESCSLTVSDPSIFGGKCFMCGAPLEANVEHTCSNKEPKKPKRNKPR